MSDNTVILSIAIPTYNGSKTIEDCLLSFISQIQGNVELVISDNCSTDKTQSIILDLQKCFPDRIRYHRNSENIGMDRNFNNAVKISKGKYVWILSDDDIVVDTNAVSKILKTIDNRHDLGSIFANYENQIVPIRKDEHELNGDEYFKITQFKNTLISSTIVNQKYWSEMDLTPYYGTYWTHIGYLIHANAKYKSAIVCSELVNQMKYEATERRWGQSGTFFNVGLNLSSIYSKLVELGYSEETCKAAHLYNYDKLFWNIVLGKAFGLSIKLKDIKTCVVLFGQFPSFWLWHFPLFFIPKFIFIQLLATFRSIKKIKKSLF